MSAEICAIVCIVVAWLAIAPIKDDYKLGLIAAVMCWFITVGLFVL